MPIFVQILLIIYCCQVLIGYPIVFLYLYRFSPPNYGKRQIIVEAITISLWVFVPILGMCAIIMSVVMSIYYTYIYIHTKLQQWEDNDPSILENTTKEKTAIKKELLVKEYMPIENRFEILDIEEK